MLQHWKWVPVDCWIERTLLCLLASIHSLTHSSNNLSSLSLLREIRSFSYSTQSLSIVSGFIIQGKLLEWRPNSSVSSKIKMDLLKYWFSSGSFIIINIHDIRNMMMMMMVQHKAWKLYACKFSEQNLQKLWQYFQISRLMITSSECRPLLSVTNKKEQMETRLWFHHTLDWVLAFSGVWTFAGLWLQKWT